MVNRFSRFKPGVSKKTLLMMSALLWTVVGMLLLTRGLIRLVSFEQVPVVKALVVISAFAAGSLKSHFILDKSAKRTISRILDFEDGTCLGAIYSIKTWIFVFCMMELGIVIRKSSIPDELFCFIYCTIGWALLLSSRIAWKVWRKAE